MQILVLGASSNIGGALARTFACGHRLTLLGRDAGRLTSAAKACTDAGALEARIVPIDLGSDLDALWTALAGVQIDLVIDAACASSGLRDPTIPAAAMRDLVRADLLSRIALFDHILLNQALAPAVIFISTILTLIKSPGRTVYTSLKQLQEIYLRKLWDDRPEIQLLIVNVGTVIDPRETSGKSDKLAAAVLRAYRAKRRNLLYGSGGLLLLVMFYCQPVIFSGFNAMQRRVRAWRARRS